MKKLIAAAAAAVLLLGMILPTGAVNSSFSDVSDPAAAVNADVLRLMGVVSGVGENRFNPGGTLTRAEFATMAVKFMQKGDLAPLYATRTIFSDVTAKHWALPYVNLAATLTVADGEKEIHLIAGVGNGRFEPDREINLAETATILLRVLGYSSKETGNLWPQSFMNLARSIGLTAGMGTDPYAPITRAQAARLFVNALRCTGGDGKAYYQTIGASVLENTIILSVNAAPDDGSRGSAIRTSANKDSESYLAAAGEVHPTALLGRRGALVLNDDNKIVAFAPDDSTSITITLSGDAQPSFLKGTNGVRYTVNENTIVYTSGAQAGVPYQSGRTSLKSGNQVTLYTENGKITAVYGAGGISETAGGAVVVHGIPSDAMFFKLTGGAENLKVMKNRQPVELHDLREWDVVTYDALSNTLVASDLRFNCIYGDASPNASAPTKIKIAGIEEPLSVLDSAWDSIRDFDLGQRVVLLLTADGKVAGMAKPGFQVSSNAIGLSTDKGVDIFRPDGNVLSLNGAFAGGAVQSGRIVSVASVTAGGIGAYELPVQTPGGDFLVREGKLGSHPVANGVRIFEKAGGTMVEIGTASLDMESIPAGKVLTFHLNTAGMADCIVLDAVTGDTYVYGRLTREIDEDKKPVVNTVVVENGTGGLGSLKTGIRFEDGDFGGVVMHADKERTSSLVLLKGIRGVRSGDFFESRGETYVTTGGRTYKVADEVECYKRQTRSWFSQDKGADRLAACRAFSGEFTIYVDPVAEKVRVVAAD